METDLDIWSVDHFHRKVFLLWDWSSHLISAFQSTVIEHDGWWTSLMNCSIINHHEHVDPVESWLHQHPTFNPNISIPFLWCENSCMKGCTNLTWAMRGYPNHPKKLGQDTHTIIAKIRIQPTNNGDLMGYITGLLGYIHIYIYTGWWFQPLWKIWVRQLGLLFPRHGKIKNVPSHQPVL